MSLPELEFIVEQKSGKVSELSRRFSKEEVKELEIMGYITTTLQKNKQGEIFWNSTKQAKEEYDIFCKPPTFLRTVWGYWLSYGLGLRNVLE